MAELKGQIFGIVLVVVLFGVIGAALISSFKSSVTNIENDEMTMRSEWANAPRVQNPLLP